MRPRRKHLSSWLTHTLVTESDFGELFDNFYKLLLSFVNMVGGKKWFTAEEAAAIMIERPDEDIASSSESEVSVDSEAEEDFLEW